MTGQRLLLIKDIIDESLFHGDMLKDFIHISPFYMPKRSATSDGSRLNEFGIHGSFLDILLQGVYKYVRH